MMTQSNPSHVEDKDTIYIVCSNYNCLKNCHDIIGIRYGNNLSIHNNLNSSNKSNEISNIY